MKRELMTSRAHTDGNWFSIDVLFMTLMCCYAVIVTYVALRQQWATPGLECRVLQVLDVSMIHHS